MSPHNDVDEKPLELQSRLMICTDCGGLRPGRPSRQGEMIPQGEQHCVQCGGESFRVVEPEEMNPTN